MTPTLAYTKCSAGGISSALDKIFRGFGDELRFARASNVNLFIPLSSPEKLKEFEQTLFDLAQIHPSRFFLLYQDRSRNDFEIEIAALCQAIAKGQHACVEIVRIGYPPDKEAGLPSILQASLLAGAPSEMLLYDANLPQLAELGCVAGAHENNPLIRLLAMSDRVFFDSAQFSAQIWRADSVLAKALLTARAQLVDLQWIELGAWRDQIKAFFSKAVFTALLEELRAISFVVAADHPAGCSALNLLRGWLLERLHLRYVSQTDANWVMHSPYGQEVSVSVKRAAGVTPGACLQEVTMDFGAERFVCWRREDKMLVTFAHAGADYKVSRTLEETDAFEALKRYLLIGESTANYEPALRMACGMFVHG